MPYLIHDGVRFFYEVSGQGPAVVLCHGLGGDLRQPAELFDALPGKRYVLWDCRGHGRTEPLGPASGYNFSTFADDLSTLLDHLGIERAIIGGISMGAGTAARFAVRSPDRVYGLVLIRPAWLAEADPPNLAIFQRIADLLESLDPPAARSALEKDPDFLAIEAISRDVADSLRRQISTEDAARRVIRLRRLPASRPIDSWDDLMRLRCPSLVIGTERDPLHPLEFARRWVERLHQSELAIIIPKAIDAGEHRIQLNRRFRSWITRCTTMET